MGWQFLSLSDAPTIDRNCFDCGEQEVNEFLINSADLCEEEGFSRVFLMISDKGEVVGYYTLGSSTVPLIEVPNKYRRGVPQFPFPAVLVGQFGIDKSWQGKGMSYLLLGDTYRRIALAYRQGVLAFRAIRVDTRTDKAKEFWQKQGFIPFKKSQNSLFIPVKTVMTEFGI